MPETEVMWLGVKDGESTPVVEYQYADKRQKPQLTGELPDVDATSDATGMKAKWTRPADLVHNDDDDDSRHYDLSGGEALGPCGVAMAVAPAAGMAPPLCTGRPVNDPTPVAAC